jgi:hypothetical protein
MGIFDLQPGESTVRNVFTSGPVTIAIQWICGRGKPFSKDSKDDVRAGVYIAGIIRYKDEIAICRSKGFFRKYNPELRRFESLNDSDYEYED